MRPILTLILLALLSGCATVALDDAGRHVRMLDATPSDLCTFQTVLDVRHNDFYYFDYSTAKTDILNTIRNDVAAIGGNAFVPVNISYGDTGARAQVDVYKCSGAVTGNAPSDLFHDSTTPGATDPADPVYQEMINQPGGWIHENDPNPVRHQMESQPGGWIHSTNPNPVKSQMCAQSWIHC